ncbi:hypothetical protein [Paenibacillus macerans]|uniref:hypothetical protein n=1 Tax=Paenibacillus macerans TaxID=44252 RepID=UPI003D31EB34
MSSKEENKPGLWTDYIRGNAEPEAQGRMEALLLRDEAAFAAYAEALSSLEQELPEPEDEAALMRAVLGALPREEQQLKPAKRTHAWSRHPLFHYVIAASITLLLLTGGFFDRMTAGAGELLNRPQQPSLSKQMMEAATGWLDGLKR